jgi:hypothetical protein
MPFTNFSDDREVDKLSMEESHIGPNPNDSPFEATSSLSSK